MATLSLVILVTVQLVRILLECCLVRNWIRLIFFHWLPWQWNLENLRSFVLIEGPIDCVFGLCMTMFLKENLKIGKIASVYLKKWNMRWQLNWLNFKEESRNQFILSPRKNLQVNLEFILQEDMRSIHQHLCDPTKIEQPWILIDQHKQPSSA